MSFSQTNMLITAAKLANLLFTYVKVGSQVMFQKKLEIY